MIASESAIDILNSLLRSELTAAEAYRQALDSSTGSPLDQDLPSVQREHNEAAATLRQHIHHFGGQSEQSSGVWGTFVGIVEATSHAIGATPTLHTLKQSEELGARSYEEALETEALPGECRMLIRSTLLPQTRQHIAILERLIEAE